MGNCTTKSTQQMQPNFIDIKSCQDIKYDNSKRKFTIHFSSLKVKNVPQEGCYIHVNFDNQNGFETPYLPQQNPHWKINHEFEYQVDDKHLKTDSFVMFHIRNKNKEDMGILKINLYLISTGPYHHDMAINWSSKKDLPGRLQFDLKMSQQVSLYLHTQEVQCTIKEGLKESAYNYSFRLITPNIEFTSEHSENIINAKQLTPNSPSISRSYNKSDSAKLSPSFNKFNSASRLKSADSLRSQDLTTKHVEEENFDKDEIKENHHNIHIKSIIYKSPLSNARNNDKNLPFNFNDSNVKYNLNLNEEAKQHVYFEQHFIHWEYDPENPNNLIDLEATLNSRDMHSSSLQLIIWSVESKQAYRHAISDLNTNKIYLSKRAGECYMGFQIQITIYSKNFFIISHISLDKLLSCGETVIKQLENQELIQETVSRFEEKLWHNGIQIGNISFLILVTSNLYLKQMMVGVMTENGVLKSSPSVYAAGVQSEHTEIKQLAVCHDQLSDLIFKTYSKKIVMTRLQKFKMKEVALSYINNLIEIINKKHKESIQSFYYRNNEELFRAQNLMIEIAKHILDFIEEIDDFLKQYYYDALKKLINRGELALGCMGFGEDFAHLVERNAEQVKFTTKHDVKLLQKKTDIGLNYQQLIYQTLKLVLSKLNFKAPSEHERSFIENFLAIAYFRIPEFRQKLLESIIKEDDPQVDEWRGTSKQLEQYQEDPKIIYNQTFNSQFFSLFDWQGCLYKFLYLSKRGEQNKDELQKILNDQTWRKRLQKRGVGFFFFVKEWAHYVNKTVVVKEHIPWQELPGYMIIIKAFLVEMKQREIYEQVDQLFLQFQKMFLKFCCLLKIPRIPKPLSKHRFPYYLTKSY